MSFKDVRDLSEHLKLLGYPKIFPLQSLCSNYGSLNSFKVVADILQWLAGRLEPGASLPGGTDTESDRVLLIRSATEFFVTKSAIKLNPRKLYASSSSAAIELQKITSLLMMKPDDDDKDEEDYKSLNQVDIGDKIEDLRRARELSSELTNRGATLYDLLCKEAANKEARITQSSRPMEISSVERALKNAITASQVKLQTSKAQLESAKVEKNALNSKLQRKKAELERSRQRLDALQKIRPAYLQEFEQYETELKELFQQYFLRIQCRDALKAQLQMRTKTTTPISTPISKPTETSIPFIPEGLIDDDDDDEDDIDYDDDQIPGIRDEDIINRESGTLAKESKERESTSRVRPTTGRIKPRTGTTLGRHKIVGSMMGDPDDDGLDSSLGSTDSDIGIGGADYDLNSDDDISISKLTGNTQIRPKTANKNDHHSDDDF